MPRLAQVRLFGVMKGVGRGSSDLLSVPWVGCSSPEGPSLGGVCGQDVAGLDRASDSSFLPSSPSTRLSVPSLRLVVPSQAPETSLPTVDVYVSSTVNHADDAITNLHGVIVSLASSLVWGVSCLSSVAGRCRQSSKLDPGGRSAVRVVVTDGLAAGRMATVREGDDGWLLVTGADVNKGWAWLQLPVNEAGQLYPPPIGIQPSPDLSVDECSAIIRELDQQPGDPPADSFDVLLGLTRVRYLVRGSTECRWNFLALGAFRVVKQLVQVHLDDLRVLSLAAEVMAALVGADVPLHVDMLLLQFGLEAAVDGGGVEAADVMKSTALDKMEECCELKDFKDFMGWVELEKFASWLFKRFDCPRGWWLVSPRSFDAWGRELQDGSGRVMVRRI